MLKFHGPMSHRARSQAGKGSPKDALNFNVSFFSLLFSQASVSKSRSQTKEASKILALFLGGYNFADSKLNSEWSTTLLPKYLKDTTKRCASLFEG